LVKINVSTFYKKILSFIGAVSPEVGGYHINHCMTTTRESISAGPTLTDPTSGQNGGLDYKQNTPAHIPG
jgi:hypothetical protein